ncbi:thyroid adenoma-associated protein homolog [Galleria mellonella]|uniref:tRNA (32-2'-O)-methyltransferase regulator THADA n=1 Tax=Galleria mellonella TaxID=7137 RepID=A0A6J1WMI6_GALME|nr:thyroid adenoma-associated protein homolog [Galleria mellonella]
MNSLSLRIVRGGTKKSKNSFGFSLIQIPIFEVTGSHVELYESFNNSNSPDEQLIILKKSLEESKNKTDSVIFEFLVVVFLQAEAKHPIKCFITRHITKNTSLQQPFSDVLACHIAQYISNKPKSYIEYVDVVMKVATCIENFPAGSDAIRAVEVSLTEYLVTCLECCIMTLRNQQTLSPTEKNEIFDLAHLAIRLLLYIVQKANTNNLEKIIAMFIAIRLYIKKLMFDNDVPMDTKSVAGILFLHMHVTEKGPDSWINLFVSQDDDLYTLLRNETAQLALYSAIPTVVATDRLQSQSVAGKSVVIVLTQKIVAIGERNPSESTLTLGVTRTILQISKTLERVSDVNICLELVTALLEFVWPHLDHHMDSVRHLTAQALANVVRYCTKLQNQGNSKPLDWVYTALSSLDKSRKSYYVSVTSLVNSLGARNVIARFPEIICDLVAALHVQPVQASATTALETLLQNHAPQASTQSIYEQWILPILSHVANSTPDSTILNILENILAKALSIDENLISYILPHIKQSCDSPHKDIKCVLMLASVAQRSNLYILRTEEDGDEDKEWRGLIRYNVLEAAAVDAVEETRVLALALAVQARRPSSPLTAQELRLVLLHLRYDAAPNPHTRQLILALLGKFIKRLEDSFMVLKRQKDSPNASHKIKYYLEFIEAFRHQCFSSLIQGANYSRRCMALQLLSWCENAHFEGYERTWTEEYVEKLLLHLEDSYENNKALALDILDKCPIQLLQLKTYSISLEVDDILTQASYMKPTECVSAAYKLDLLVRRLPQRILQGNSCSTPEPVIYVLVERMLHDLRGQLQCAVQSIVSAARSAPLHGLLHCLRRALHSLNARAISEDEQWRSLISQVIDTCMEVTAAVASVVNNSSPEGHLPMDASGVSVTDTGNSGGVMLEDGRPVTAQMVLLCAWRSVKEVSLLLGTISSRLTVEGEGGSGGTLSAEQLQALGEHFTSLLAHTKHRGAFEQAYVGFTRLLARLWRCRSARLHGLPASWLRGLLQSLAAGGDGGTLCATRRSAGLPFMIQAIVTTEIEVQSNPKCFHQCMRTLLRLACPPSLPHKYQDGYTIKSRNATATNNHVDSDEIIEIIPGDVSIETRTHSLNILRALFRNSALEESVASYVGTGFIVALSGFDGDTWAERNSSTLALSALVSRVFGVARPRTSKKAASRTDTMTGRIFFLRYPRLYDFMLEKLKEASTSEDSQLRPSLYPILLLLARLYPSSLEGTVSTLKLVAFIPHVLSCARSSVLKIRQLAAKAMVPLISPEQYIPHLEMTLTIITDVNIKRNYCHGILLQLVRLFASKPERLCEVQISCLSQLLRNTHWILEQAVTENPCYLLADEYVKMINLVLWRFPTLLQKEIISNIETSLEQLLFTKQVPIIDSGRDICLANALYLYIIILHKQNINKIPDTIYKGLSHKSYEVILSTLNYLLILHKNIENDSCKLQEHLYLLADDSVLKKLRENHMYIETLCEVYKNSKYLECIQKTLKVLTLERDTQKRIIEIKSNITNISDECTIKKLIEFVQDEHYNLIHIYLECLSTFVSRKIKESDLIRDTILSVIRVIYACSSSDNTEDTRSVVVDFLEKNLRELSNLNLDGMSDEDKFEYKATLLATTVTLLEDDEESLRQRTSNTVLQLVNKEVVTTTVIPSKAAELLRDYIEEFTEHNMAIFLVLALLDFKSEVCLTDEITDECRVFDQNERYNIFLEESILTSECGDKILQLCGKQSTSVIKYILAILDNNIYKRTFENLCNNHIVTLRKIIDGDLTYKNSTTNPKIELLLKKLST